MNTQRLALLTLACVALALLASPAEAQITGCQEASSDAVEGHYTGRASFAIRATGNVEMIQFMPTSIDGEVTLDATVDRQSDVHGTATGQGTSGIVARSPGGLSRHSRQDSGSGALSGTCREGEKLHITGGMEMTLTVTSVSCGSVRGTVDTGSGLISELAGGWRGVGLNVSITNALWELNRDGRNPALETQVDSMVNQLNSVTDPLAPSTPALLVAAAALGTSLTPGPGQPRDPYRECLGQRLLAAMGPIQAKRAEHFMAPFRSRVANGPMSMQLWRDAVRELRLASMYGCEVAAELDLLVRSIQRITDRRAHDGASAAELVGLLRLLENFGLLPDVYAGMTRCNELAQAGGHPPPFRVPAH